MKTLLVQVILQSYDSSIIKDSWRKTAVTVKPDQDIDI